MLDKWIAPLVAYATLIYGLSSLDPRPLKQWSPVGADAYVEIVNNTKIDLPIFVRAPAVDSTTRYIGTVPSCDHKRFKLPYVDTKVVVLAADASYVLNAAKPKTYSIDIYAGVAEYACVYWTKTVSGIVEFVDPASWRASGFSRLGEVETPVKVVLAGDDTACPIYEISTELIRTGDYFTCKKPWRVRRS